MVRHGDLLVVALACSMHAFEQLTRPQALRTLLRWRRLPKNQWGKAAISDRQVRARPHIRGSGPQPRTDRTLRLHERRKAGDLAAVVDLFSRRVVGWSMSTHMTAQLVIDALIMAIRRWGKVDVPRCHSARGNQYTGEQLQWSIADHCIIRSMVLGPLPFSCARRATQCG